MPTRQVIYLTRERFLHAAMLLPEGKFLGLQMEFGKERDSHIFVFSSDGLKTTKEDYNWMFQNCAVVEDDSYTGMSNIYKDRHIYVLSYVHDSTLDTIANTYKVDDMFDDWECDKTDRKYVKNNIEEMFNMCVEAGAVIQIIAGTSEAAPKEHGMILISLPEEMTLRMRTMITHVFPHMAVEELPVKKNIAEATRYISDTCLLENISHVLLMFVSGLKTIEAESQKIEISSDEQGKVNDEENAESSDEYTPIEDLELSVRTYNCLKHAGIKSIEKLSTMTEDDLSKLRNMGRRQIEEVKNVLTEYQRMPAVVPLKAERYMDKLENLIGLEEVKEQVKRIEAFAKMKIDMTMNGKNTLPVALNMEFVGNPGTAKTTVARILAGILLEVNILDSNELIEVGRADLVAKYEGQTAAKVKEIFKKAKGKMLFIDEAYSLVENWEGEFGDEAINTIVQEMENHREDTVVVFAGYPGKMDDLFSRNPGLRSRVPFSISFKDYSADEMVCIAELEAEKRGFSFDEGARHSLQSICREVSETPEAGNGRFCRNLVENAILGYASRVYGNDSTALARDYVLTAEDISHPSLVKKKSHGIGFVA